MTSDPVVTAAPVSPSGADTELELSVVLPCLNEAETVVECVREARRTLDRMGLRGEVLIADNGSVDGSPELARSAGARVVDVPMPGYGAALLGGIEAARSEFIVMADADGSYDLGDLEPFVAALRNGADLVMGNRFEGGIEAGAMPKLHRLVGNPVLSWLGRLFFRSPVRDFHCGMRAFRRSSIRALNLRTTGMEFASEMIVKATLAHDRIEQVPTRLAPDRRSRPPHLRTWRDGWRHLRFLLLYSPRWLFLYPGCALILVGSVLGTVLLFGPLDLGAFTLDVNSLLYSAVAVIVGFQSVLFSALAAAFAVNAGLRPTSQRVDRLFRHATLEKGLLLGSVLLLTGLGISVYALFTWDASRFGALDTSTSFRIVIPAVTAIILGFETILSSFLFSVLALHRR
jgi:glycosyltransferase involved in cell wall biosynthesis